MAFCPNCGTEIQDGAQFCPNCGKPTNPAAAAAAAAANAANGSSSIQIIKKALAVVMQKPIKLWGLSLLVVLLSTLAKSLGGAVPIIGLSVGLVLELGMAWVFLDGYRNKDVSVDQVFEGFHNFWHSLACVGWREILLVIWAVVPIAIGVGGASIIFSAFVGDLSSLISSAVTAALFGGFGRRGFGSMVDSLNLKAMTAGIVLAVILVLAGLIVGCVFAIIKSYAYSFVPYLTREDETRKATDVARDSDAQTKGYKGKMFLTDLLIALCIGVIELVLSLLGKIPYAGGLFRFVLGAVKVVVFALAPLFMGLVRAAWYDEITKKAE
ncbi:MAG: DUF975 family protein [Lachnospiraceae bacterium]|nr:DUF975 family protein [Lachnospiraceae bacterium]